MAGLNDLLTDSSTQTTTLPSWYDSAQQSMLAQAGDVMKAAPSIGQTAAQNAINTMQNDPFAAATQNLQNMGSSTQMQGANAAGNQLNQVGAGGGVGAGSYGQSNALLNQYAQGALNPFNPDGTPNTGTAMGGLFNAQSQQLKQLMPNITAGANAAAIGSGGFGGLRNATAANKALGDAQANMMVQQNQAALQNQQMGAQAASQMGTLGNQATQNQINAGIGAGNVYNQGVGNMINAASASGNVAQQGINNALTVGGYQQNAAFNPIANYSKILGATQAPQTVTNTTQLSPLAQIGSLSSLVSNPNLATGLSGLVNTVKGLF